jgi:serine/threonine protein kinase
MSTLPSQPKPLVKVGEIIAGKFKVERILGEGGMGLVVAARHIQLDERVALKFLRPEMTTPDTVARFAQEARAAVKLKSEHVARVIDVGTREDGLPFIVMEYLRGKNLGDLLQESGALPIEAAVELMIQACEGLAEAHARGIVHRDIKPENLFLVEHGDGWRTLKILDFGISKAALTGSALGHGHSNIKTQSIMGSPCYMSPEQLRSTRSVDHRADLWSIGAVLFELLTGTTAFDADLPLTELIATILEQEPPRLGVLLPEAPEALEDAISRCLEQDRDLRFQNAAELAIALMPFAPKRSRVAVERAATVTRAAGLAEPTLIVPTSVAPPPMDTMPNVPIPPHSSPGSLLGPMPGPVPIGTSNFGKYRLAASLSHSSLWDVFLGVPRVGGHRLVIVKKLRPDLAGDPDLRVAFLREARISMDLHDPHVVQTFEAGEHDGAPFVATEFIDGHPLDALILEAKRAGLRISPILSARMIEQAAAGVRYIHEREGADGKSLHAVHAAVNPRNLFVTHEGHLKIVDFGLAKAAFVSQATESLLRDTRGYLAPEQGLGKAGDARSDTFALGVVLWELLADRRLPRADAADSALQRFGAQAAPLLTDLVTDVDADLTAIVARAVDRDPTARFQTGRELEETLRTYLENHAGPDTHAIGELVQELFATQREQLGREIEGAVLRAMSSGEEGRIVSIAPERRRRNSGFDGPVSSGNRTSPTVSRPPTSSRRPVSPQVDEPRASDAAGGFEAGTGVARPPPRRVAIWVAIGSSAAAATLAGVLLLGGRGAMRPPELASAAATGVAPVASSTPTTTPSAVPSSREAAAASAPSTDTPTPSATIAPSSTPARAVKPALPPAPRFTGAAAPKPGGSPDLDIRMHR